MRNIASSVKTEKLTSASSLFSKSKKAHFQMKRAFIAIVDIFDVYQLLRHQAFTFWLDIKLQDGPPVAAWAARS